MWASVTEREYMPCDQHGHDDGASSRHGHARPGARAIPPPRFVTPPAHLADPRAFLAALPTMARRSVRDSVLVLVVDRGDPRGLLHGTLDRLDHVLTAARSGAVAVRAALELSGGAALLAGFGPPERVDPHVRSFLTEAAAAGLPVLAAYRATGDRFWSYLCEDEDCCPAEGASFEPQARTTLWKPPDPVAERRNGSARPMEREAVESEAVESEETDPARVRALLEPVVGEQRAAVAESAALLEERFRAERGREASRSRIRRVRSVVRREVGERIRDPDTLAMLGVALLDLRVRDAVWARITPEEAPLHRRLWSRVTRHVPHRHRAGPASLLAVAAWQAGDMALARAAVQSALAARPGYAMAVLMERALGWGLSAERWARHMAENADRFEFEPGVEDGEEPGSGRVPPSR